MTKRVLVLYGTTDGQTRKIAGAIAEAVRTAGDDADVVNARHPVPDASPDDYDSVIVAASVHAGGYQRTVRRWVRRHLAALRAKPTAFVSVCLGVLEHKESTDRELNRILARFFDRTGWQPTIVKIVAGALPFSRYGWLKRRVMVRIVGKTMPDVDPSRDYEFTDWKDLETFVADFRQRTSTLPFVRAAS
jgi:menaquinone-dependent protoporphyrinogen oxidase